MPSVYILYHNDGMEKATRSVNIIGVYNNREDAVSSMKDHYKEELAEIEDDEDPSFDSKSFSGKDGYATITYKEYYSHFEIVKKKIE